MPTVPRNSKCETIGCKNPRAKYSVFCLAHGGRDTQRTYHSTDKRKQADALYGTARWANHRKMILSRSPLCAACSLEGKVTLATDVDHVFPWARIGNEAFYANLFQSLCHPCHSAKTSLERRDMLLYYGAHLIRYTLADYARVVLQDTRIGQSGQHD